ncbi:MAG: DUF5702 domain-containing protein [Anaerovoracaceae bacterium]
MNLQRSRKGSVIIMIMLFFLSLIILIFAFTNASKEIGVKGSVNSLGRLWANSILGEFDINLQGRYGLFGFYGFEKDISSKLDYYANYSFQEKKYIDWGGCRCSLYDYSLGNPNNVKKQIVEVGKLNLVTKEDAAEQSQMEDRDINNKKILMSLPSSGMDNSLDLDKIGDTIKNLKSLEGIATYGSEKFFINTYIKNYFKNNINSKGLGETYFRNEMEYIIGGNSKDRQNLSNVKIKIIAIRNVLNFAYLMTDETKKQEAIVAAQLITPGPVSLATQMAILEGWALVESSRDYSSLIDGKKVPFMKTKETWGRDDNSEDEKGTYYEDYLMSLICFVDDNVKLLRIMDLIQINMKFLYYGDFLISEYSSGLNYKMQVNGKNYEFNGEY